MGRSSWITRIPVFRQRISNSEMLEEITLSITPSNSLFDWYQVFYCGSMSLLYSSERQGLSQPITKWQGSCQALPSCALTAACDPSSLRKTWLEYPMEIQGSPTSTWLLVITHPDTPAKSWLGCLILGAWLHICFSFRHLWWKTSSSTHFSPMHWAEHARCSNLCVKIHSHTSPRDTDDVQQQLLMKMGLSNWGVGTSNKITPRAHLVRVLLDTGRNGGLVLPKITACLLRKS